MKRIVALILACCLTISALSTSAFAAGSLVGVEWDSATSPQHLGISGGSPSSVFDPVPLVNNAVPKDIQPRFSDFSSFEIISGDKSWTFTKNVEDYVSGTKKLSFVYSSNSDISGGRTSSLMYYTSNPIVAIDFVGSNLICFFSNGRSQSLTLLLYEPFHIEGTNYKIRFSDAETPSDMTIYYRFAPVRRISGFGSILNSASHAAPPQFSYDLSSLYIIPAGSALSYSFDVSVDGLDGFGSENSPASMSIELTGPDGSFGGGSASLATYSRVDGGKYIYHFSGLLTPEKNFYSYVNFLVSMTSPYFDGHFLTVNLESCHVKITQLAESSLVPSPTDQVINNISDTLVKNNTEVITQITAVVGVLNNLLQNSVTVNGYLDSLVGSINAMGGNLDSVLAYLREIVQLLNYFPEIMTKLDSVGLNPDTVRALADSIASAISFEPADLSQVESYLLNTMNQISHISDVVDSISEQLEISNRWFVQFAEHLVKIDADVGFCSSYLQGIYNTLSKFIAEDTAEMVKYLNESNTNILELLREVQSIRQSIGDDAGKKLDEIIKNLVSQGTSIDGIKSFVSSIKQNTAESAKLLGDILAELQKVEAENAETNDRLQAIQDAIKDFEIKISNTTNNVLTDSDQKGLGALISNLITHLLSIIDFVTDFFGGIFTSVPSTISAYNDCNAFWGDQKTYIYTPHQLSGYQGQGGSSYENSNDSVQKLFAEAEKYLGYPYVFGGSSPETSFDCSGFVCYALSHSGVYSIGRTTAQGLYNACTPVDRLDAKPGDLVFFTGTYDCPDVVSHVGFYAGDGKMLHCGDPIQYTSIDTSYWQAHFYAFGRLPYNSNADSEGG